MSWLCNIFDLFLSPWIRIPNTDPDPEDPWIRIRNTVRVFTDILNIHKDMMTELLIDLGFSWGAMSYDLFFRDVCEYQ